MNKETTQGIIAAATQPVSLDARPGTFPEIKRQVLQHRAIEAIIWGMPAVNRDLMYQAMLRETACRDNQMLYWSRLLDWKTQTLTPNTDVIYFTPYFDSKEVGPIVLEIPPADDGAIVGHIMDAWQMPLEDIGVAGVDQGKGGKYLILPPRYNEKVPEGYIVLPSLTYKGYALIRSVLKSGSEEDLAKAVEYGKRMKIYPLSQAQAPPPTVYVDAAGVLYDSTIPYDIRFFESLDRIVQYEPWLERDRTLIDTLRMIGIEKGKPFAPDAECTKLLNEAAAQGHAFLDGTYKEVVRGGAFVKGSRWSFPESIGLVFKASQEQFADPNLYPVDARGLLFSFIFFTPKRMGEGQFYLMAIDDKEGQTLDGGKTYRLNIPANAPIRQYWSATIYDFKTHALIREISHAARSSQSPGLQVNADGSVDLYFGPRAPEGKESNWTPTDPNGEFEILFRFYGPLPSLFDKTWVLPDVERIE
ncbi:DUF1254 domain-containing protein [Synechococcus sp. J7-Johnson]|uniref:DUF1254 domain-containing protein n=1 Tax=Synechococcus sp. J7-Johnson TaxID=2823737 RepID=UPI0020CC9145|nr:DUF1254 domain-containing protein [Synechococcus sp. J7-Johnson]MCP9841969.1 DUF1254 domain-containing protein [Synechococcus sp. J7-Johnson]